MNVTSTPERSDSTADIADLRDAIDVGWILICTALVFWEQAGFAMLEAGSVRARNISNILLKNILDAAFGAVIFAAVGYGLAFGQSASGFLGTTHFFLHGLTSSRDLALWAWHWSFAATAATTVSGCVAERIDCVAYFVCSTIITGFVYTVPVHWVWSDDGFLSVWNSDTLFSSGVIDFAGSGLVHMLGGVAGLVGSLMLGPRIGRFPYSRFAASFASCFMVTACPRKTIKDNEARANNLSKFTGHNLTLTALGVYCLWFGWFGFNAGCTGGLSQGAAKVASIAVVNTAISPSFGAIAAVVLTKARTGVWSLPSTINGLLAGLVGITGPCGVVSGGSAAVIGAISGAVYTAAAFILDRACIDDPVEAIAIHAFPGAWGVLASGLFAQPRLLDDAGYDFAHSGLFFGGAGDQLGTQMLGVLLIFGWTCLASTAAFLVGHFATKAFGNSAGLRVTAEHELQGLDVTKHGGAGYSLFPSDIAVSQFEPLEYQDEGVLSALEAKQAPLVQALDQDIELADVQTKER
jgi:Amt family ammonium transporter